VVLGAGDGRKSFLALSTHHMRNGVDGHGSWIMGVIGKITITCRTHNVSTFHDVIVDVV
jgi:hypothetical protein